MRFCNCGAIPLDGDLLLFLLRLAAGDDLDGHLLTGVLTHGEIDHAHVSAAEFTDDLVFLETTGQGLMAWLVCE